MAAKKRRLYLDLTGDSVQVEDDPTTAREHDDDETLQAFLDEYGAGSHKISLYRLKPGTARWEWLAHYVPDQISQELIREEWGPGSYNLTLLDSRGHYITRKAIDIGGTADDWDRVRGIRRRDPEGGGVDNTTLELMRQQHETLLAFIQAGSRNDHGSLKDIIEAWGALKEQSSSNDQLKFATEVIGLAQKLNGGSDSVVGLIKEVAPALLEQIPGAMTALRGKGASTPRLPAAPNAGQPETPAAPEPREVRPKAPPPGANGQPAQPAELSQADQVNVLLMARLQYWKGKARRGSDVGLWVDYVLENDDDSDAQAVLYAVRHFTFDTIVGLDPEIAGDAQLRAWFRALYDGIREELFNPADTGGTLGDAANAGSDAPAGDGGRTQPDSSGNGRGAAEVEPAVQPG